MPLLHVTIEGTEFSRRLLVREDRFTVGRSSDCAIQIPDPSVSKWHVEITRRDDGFGFRDLSSGNGTFLNNIRLDEAPLKDGDVLRLGRATIVVQFDRAEAPIDDAPPHSKRRSRGGAARPERVSAFGLVLHDLARVRRGLFGTVGVVILIGLGVGFFFWKRGDGGPVAERPPPLAALGTVPPPPGSAQVPLTMSNAPGSEPAAPAPNVERDAAADAEAALEVGRLFLAGAEQGYASPEESRRVLFRLFLDLLGRTPTRAESLELAVHSHLERWRWLLAKRDAEPGAPPYGGTPHAIERRFSGREPERGQTRALRSVALTESASFIPAAFRGAYLLSAAPEYRAAAFRRERTLKQRAGSLLVDLLDRPPSSKAEVEDLEGAIGDFPGGSSVARVLAFSSGASGSATVPERGEFARSEIERFLLRQPREPELAAIDRELAASPDGFRWVRLALASTPEYRTY